MLSGAVKNIFEEVKADIADVDTPAVSDHEKEETAVQVVEEIKQALKLAGEQYIPQVIQAFEKVLPELFQDGR